MFLMELVAVIISIIYYVAVHLLSSSVVTIIEYVYVYFVSLLFLCVSINQPQWMMDEDNGTYL